GSAYRPILLLSYAAQWWIHGRVPEAFHLVNVLLHIGATLLLGGVLLRARVPPSAAALATLFFAVAPIHVEAVTSLVGRGETLAAVFSLAFLFVALGAGEETPRPGRVLAALLCYGLGILTKESAAVAPGLLLLLLAYRESGTLVSRFVAALRRGWPVFAGAALVLAGTVGLRSWVLGGLLRAPGVGIFEVENPLAGLPWPSRAVNASLILLRYAGRALFPAHLSADESAWSIRPGTALFPLGIAAAALLLVLAALALARLSSGSAVALGVLFFGVAFLPTANVLYPIGTIFGERIAYLPSAGLCLALGSAFTGGAAGVSSLSPAARRTALGIAILFSLRTITRNAVWWSDSSVFANSLATAPGSAKAHYNQAYVFAEAGRWAEAFRHYSRAVAIYSDYWDAWAGKGRMEKELGRLHDSEASYRRALAANPWYENGYFGLGLALEAQGRLPEAEETYRLGLRHNKDSLPLVYRRALVLSRQDAPGAGQAWNRALALGPLSAAVHADRAEWLLSKGFPAQAATEARAALRIDPNSSTAWRVLARRWMAAAADRPLAAALALEKACRSSRDAEDLRALERLVEANPEYGPRLERVRPALLRAIAQPSSSPLAR
ncbi:MAG TPA: tetratricopeptide repeat protein, partial [Thermoanaerobaculia bacterium]|nr:tetratricopeptide repeat protein [Thermoanaerobaculia bacterium]